jgi:hypothetical protein
MSFLDKVGIKITPVSVKQWGNSALFSMKYQHYSVLTMMSRIGLLMKTPEIWEEHQESS